VKDQLIKGISNILSENMYFMRNINWFKIAPKEDLERNLFCDTFPFGGAGSFGESRKRSE
jgi:hypothetical protein